MRHHIVRSAAIAAALALMLAGCSSSKKGDKSPNNTFPTTHIPTSTLGRTTTVAPTTAGSASTTSGPSVSTTTLAPGVTTVPTIATTTTVKQGPPPTYQNGILARWKLALDYRTHPGHNPFADYLNTGPAVWSLREGSSSSRNGLYPLLPTFASAFQSPALAAWHDNSAGCPKLPAVGVNTVDGDVPQCTASIPGGAAFLEPSSGHPAIVAWTSPFTGLADISHNAVADLDGTCGDGVSYFVDLGTKQLSAIRLTNNNSASLPGDKERVVKGQSLYFIVDPGPGTDASCDATQVAVTIDHLVG
jgi:hypothetical protein